MEVENMRDALIHRYPSSEWAYKVKHMPDEQVIAIYNRLLAAKQFDPPPKPTHIPAKPVPLIFYCADCEQAFQADNPDTAECRYCGSKHISGKAPFVTIRKE